ncbi:MAG TPA: hypothetical protein VGK59_18120 [Ohtaekwangia sp.]
MADKICTGLISAFIAGTTSEDSSSAGKLASVCSVEGISFSKINEQIMDVIIPSTIKPDRTRVWIVSVFPVVL